MSMSTNKLRKIAPMKRSILLYIMAAGIVLTSAAWAEDNFSSIEAPASPKKPWQQFQVISEHKPTRLMQVLLYLPNRILDFWDMFRIDVGVGPAAGAVVRLTKYVQFGYREPLPWSFRVGDFGRRAPFLLEESAEGGVSPYYEPSPQRTACKLELGTGVDLLIVSGYIGICTEEVPDFMAGILMYDPALDDLE